MNDKPTPLELRIKEIGSSFRDGADVVFLIQLSDKSLGKLSCPADEAALLIDRIQYLTIGRDRAPIPEIEVLRVDPARTSDGTAILMFHTKQAHTFACMLSREQADGLQERLADFGDLPLADEAAPHH